MSTYLFLQCLDHDPPLLAEHESGQHLYNLPQIRADIAARATLVNALPQKYEYFRWNTINFLMQHQKCRIGIQDEYGVDYPLTEEAGEAD